MKKVLSLILALTLLISAANVFALPVFGEEMVNSGYCGAEDNGTNLTWQFDGKETLTIRGTGKMRNYDWKGSHWSMYHRQKIKNVIICEGVTSIGEYAFDGHYNLNSITIPNSVTSIGEAAFWDCERLTSISIPSNVVSINGFVFYNCSSLSEITVDPANKAYYVKQNCLIEAESGRLLRGTNGSVIPDDGTITGIGGGAFYGCDGLTSLIIPDGVKYIGEGAIESCDDLTEIYIPKSVTDIYCDLGNNPKLTDIYCEAESKPEGWGNYWNTSSATVHWGYKKSIPGDTDGDGKVNTNDIIYLLNYLIFDEDYPVNQNVDFDGDGKVNTYDAIYLLNHLIFEDEYPLS